MSEPNLAGGARLDGFCQIAYLSVVVLEWVANQMRRGRLYDLAVVSPLIAWNLLAIVGFAIEMRSSSREGLFSGHATLELWSDLLTILFLSVQSVLFFVRNLPVARQEGGLPRAVAIFGYGAGFGFLLLPRAPMSPMLTAVAYGFSIGGTLASIWVLLWLGRGFSIFPQARALVMSGPYRWIRHPLYLSELIGSAGIMLLFRQPWSLLIWSGFFAAQFFRMHFEEEVLCRAFPQYRDYMRDTRRLIPRIY